MGRITRKKAAEVAEALHIDEDAVLEAGDENEDVNILKAAKKHHLEQNDREPLGELETNSAESKSQSDDATQELKKSTRGKKGSKRGAKGKKNNLAASTASQMDIPEVPTDLQDVMPDENDATPSPASEKAAEELLKDVPDKIPVKPTDAQTKAVKLTRSQLAKVQTEPKSLVDGIGQTAEEQEAMKEELVSTDADDGPAIMTGTLSEDNSAEREPVTQLAIDAPASPLPNAVPTVIARLRADTPAKRSTSNKENVEPPQDIASPHPTPSATTSDSATPQPSSSRPADPIAALDELDEAVDNVSKDIPEVQTSPEKPKVKRESKKAAPVVRGTKASQARISLAQNPDAASKPPTFGQPRPSTTLGRSNSVRQGGVANPQAATRRAPSGNTGKDAEAAANGEKKEVVIPHSKPRPVSLSFPAPPPPAKSTKAPTQSTFQLSGDAVAAKLKAAREARMQKEAEEQKPTFKARPVPSSLSKAPSIRQTTASKARESIMASKDPKGSNVAANAAQKRVSSTATKAPSAPKPRVVSKDTSKPATVSSKPASGDLVVKKRPSTTLANASKARASFTTATEPNTSAQRAPSNTTKGTVKGKEVFNRAAAAKAAAEKDKQEKEAAAKKARADAAERGRQASREWAEKQKKMAATKKAGPAQEVKVPTEVIGEEKAVTEQSATPPVEAASVETPVAAAVEAS